MTGRTLPTPVEYEAAYYATAVTNRALDIAADRADADEWRSHAVALHGDTPASQARHRATLAASVKAHDTTRRTA